MCAELINRGKESGIASRNNSRISLSFISWKSKFSFAIERFCCRLYLNDFPYDRMEEKYEKFLYTFLSGREGSWNCEAKVFISSWFDKDKDRIFILWVIVWALRGVVRTEEKVLLLWWKNVQKITMEILFLVFLFLFIFWHKKTNLLLKNSNNFHKKVKNWLFYI